jgi:hypothetical protein
VKRGEGPCIPDVYCLGVGRLDFPLAPWQTRHFITADPDFGSGPEGAGRNVFVPLMLTEKGKRANLQNEIVDEEQHAAARIRWCGDRDKSRRRSKSRTESRSKIRRKILEHRKPGVAGDRGVIAGPWCVFKDAPYESYARLVSGHHHHGPGVKKSGGWRAGLVVTILRILLRRHS